MLGWAFCKGQSIDWIAEARLKKRRSGWRDKINEADESVNNEVNDPGAEASRLSNSA